MKFHWEYTLHVSVMATLIVLIVSFLWIFDRFKASSDLPKTVEVFVENANGKRSTIGALKFESGIQKQLREASSNIPSGAVSKKDSLNIKNLLFHYNPFLLIWGLIIVVLASVGAGSFPLVIDRIAALYIKFKISGVVLVIMIILMALIAIGMHHLPGSPYLSDYAFWTPFADVIFKDHNTMNIVVITMLVLALPALFGIAILFLAGHNLRDCLKKKDYDEFDRKYKEIHDALSFFLVILTSLITLTVLATGAFRKALLAVVNVEGLDIAPIEFVYLYGAFFTIFLALFYAPVYLQLLSFKNETLTNEKLTVFKDSQALQSSRWETIKVLISLFAPLLSSILPGVLS